MFQLGFRPKTPTHINQKVFSCSFCLDNRKAAAVAATEAAHLVLLKYTINIRE